MSILIASFNWLSQYIKAFNLIRPTLTSWLILYNKWDALRKIRRLKSHTPHNQPSRPITIFSPSCIPIDPNIKSNNAAERLVHIQSMEKEVDFIARHISTNSIVVDIGSNIGGFTGFFLKRGNSVISVEPLLRNARKQAIAFSSYIDDGKLFLYNVACSDKADKSLLLVSNDADASFSSIEERWMTDVFCGSWSGKAELVDTCRLSDILRLYSGKGPISCVKIDVEGHENKVLVGLFHHLPEDCFPIFIMFEFNTRNINLPFFNKSVSLLKQNGYSEFKYFVRHGEILLYESDWATNDFDISQWNGAQGAIPAVFRYGNAIARRTHDRTYY